MLVLVAVIIFINDSLVVIVVVVVVVVVVVAMEADIQKGSEKRREGASLEEVKRNKAK